MPAPASSHPRLAAAFAVAPDVPAVPVSPRVARVGNLALKSFGPEEVPRARLEAAILRHLEGGDGYSVQSIVRPRTGADLHVDADGALLATRWEEGAPVPYGRIPVDGWRRLGGSLASLHRRLETPGAPEAPARLGELVRARDLAVVRSQLLDDLTAARERGERGDPGAPAALRLLDARRRLLDARGARDLPAGRDDGALIHNDFNEHNYLFGGARAPVVVDWERAIGAPREYEVARCLAHLPAAWPEAARAFLDAYLAVRPLDVDAMRGCLDVALTEHAAKRWPVARWLAGEPDAAARLASLAPVVESLSRGCDVIERFYRAALGGGGPC